MLVLGAALTLLLTLSACGRQTVIRTTDTLDQAEQEASAAEPLPAEPAAGEEETACSLDPAAVTDDFAADTLIRLPELALSGLGFTFDTPRELTSQQLYLLFLAWSAPETLDACYNAADSSYIFSADLICQTLDRYLVGYSFTVTFCDGGYRYQSVRQLSQPELRPNVGTLLLYEKEQEAFAAVTEEEICLWDSASGGQLLAVARFPITLPGAKDALKRCDFTDLDEDGSSELTAEFSFADGSTVSLVWFFTDGGLVYNEEFSRLPGEASASGTD